MVEGEQNMVNDIEKILETIDLETTPPLEEPMRQYYFLKKARKYIEEASKKAGRFPAPASLWKTFCFLSFHFEMLFMLFISYALRNQEY